MSIFRCPECDFVFDEAQGVPREGFPPGTPFADVPDDWSCPDCGVRDKLDFVGSVAGGSGPHPENAPAAPAPDTEAAVENQECS